MNLYLSFCHFKNCLYNLHHGDSKGFLHFIIQWAGKRSHYKAGIFYLRERYIFF